MSDDLKQCAECGQFNRTEDKECIRCGKALGATSKTVKTKTKTGRANPGGEKKGGRGWLWIVLAVVAIAIVFWMFSGGRDRALDAGLAEGQKLTEDGEYQAAQESLVQTLASFEQAPEDFQTERAEKGAAIKEALAANLLAWAGSVESELPDAALDHYRKVLQDYPDAPSAEQARQGAASLLLARTRRLAGEGRLADAVNGYAELVASYPGTLAANQAAEARRNLYATRSVDVAVRLDTLRSRQADREGLGAALQDLGRRYAESQGLLLYSADAPAGPAATLTLRYNEAYGRGGSTNARVRLQLQREGEQGSWQETVGTTFEGRIAWSAEPGLDESQAQALSELEATLGEIALPADAMSP